MTTIRRATVSDLPAVLTLLDRYYTEWTIWQPDAPATILTYLQHPQLGFFLAETDGQPVACVLLRPLPAIPHAAECKRLYVVPEARGQSLANRLMDAVEAHARDLSLTYIYLDSKAEFATAIALYRRRGYEEIPRFNDNPQATIFLRKRLTPANL